MVQILNGKVVCVDWKIRALFSFVSYSRGLLPLAPPDRCSASTLMVFDGVNMIIDFIIKKVIFWQGSDRKRVGGIWQEKGKPLTFAIFPKFTILEMLFNLLFLNWWSFVGIHIKAPSTTVVTGVNSKRLVPGRYQLRIAIATFQLSWN